MQDWQVVEPQFSSPAIYTPAFKDTIQSGHFVKVEVDGMIHYGRIIATSHSALDVPMRERPIVEVTPPMVGYLKMNWYFRREELPVGNGIADHPRNIYMSSVDELFQTPFFNWILSSFVTELIFVFHYADIVCGNFCCSGIENAFFVRYQYRPETNGCIYIDKSTYHPFPSCSMMFWQYWSSCWSQDVWEGICLMQQTITSILCRYSQNQGTHPSGHKKVCISVAVMQYIQAWLASRHILLECTKCHQMSSHIRDSLICIKTK